MTELFVPSTEIKPVLYNGHVVYFTKVNPSEIYVKVKGKAGELRIGFYDFADHVRDGIMKIILDDMEGFNWESLYARDEDEDKELYKFMSNEFRKAKSKHPEIFSELPDTVTEKWVIDMLHRLGMDPKTWYYSINSFGGGNHYCEYDVNEENNLYGIAVHCGSRNFGVKVCKYWENKSKGAALSKAEMKEYTAEFKKAYIEEHIQKYTFFCRDFDVVVNVNILEGEYRNIYNVMIILRVDPSSRQAAGFRIYQLR